MTDFNWCHGPSCHKSHTVDRVRGVKGSKVLRTRKVKYWSGSGIYNYFCSQSCYNEFANKYIQEVIAIAPRTEALETPIKDPVKAVHQNQGYYSNYTWYETKIEVDETRCDNNDNGS